MSSENGHVQRNTGINLSSAIQPLESVMVHIIQTPSCVLLDVETEVGLEAAPSCLTQSDSIFFCFALSVGLSATLICQDGVAVRTVAEPSAGTIVQTLNYCFATHTIYLK
jgi:hypothetical protein